MLEVVAVRVIPGFAPLQTEIADEVRITGIGFTVTVMVKVGPWQLVIREVGVTRYWTVPDEAWPGLVNTWLIVVPDPALAPVIEPVMVPMVHEKLLGTLDERLMPGLLPLQTEAVEEFVTKGSG